MKSQQHWFDRREQHIFAGLPAVTVYVLCEHSCGCEKELETRRETEKLNKLPCVSILTTFAVTTFLTARHSLPVNTQTLQEHPSLSANSNKFHIHKKFDASNHPVIAIYILSQSHRKQPVLFTAVMN